MNELITYLLKVSLGISLLSLPYYLFLRNDPQLLIKRIYLLSGIVLAWIFPLLVLSKPEIVQNMEPIFFIDPGSPSTFSSASNAVSSPGFSIKSIVPFIYISGIIYLFLRTSISFFRVKYSKTNSKSSGEDIVYTGNDQVFTIFPKIFLPKKYSELTELESILIHERAHISQLHIIDLLLVEFTLLLTWFNPFSWLISRMIKENHEHLADRAVLSQGVKPAHYKALLLNHAMGGQVFRLGHQFNHSLTKKRFDMMKKMKASKKGMLKYFIIVPAILAFTLIATATAQNTKTIHGKVYLEKEGEVAVGASVVIANSTQGTVVDMDGSFTLEVEGNPEVVISFIGYKNVRKTAKEIMAAPVIMQPATYKIDLDYVEASSSEPEDSKLSELPQSGDKEIFYIVEDLPSFPGGNAALKKYMSEKLVYPETAKKKKLEGKVMLQFKVSGKGSLSEIEVLESTDPSFSKSAIKLIEGMPAWNPGKQRGKAVNTKVILPVVFKLQQD